MWSSNIFFNKQLIFFKTKDTRILLFNILFIYMSDYLLFYLAANKKMVHGKASSTKKDPLVVIPVSWKHFDKDYCFNLVKSILKRIMAVVKARKGSTKY